MKAASQFYQGRQTFLNVDIHKNIERENVTIASSKTSTTYKITHKNQELTIQWELHRESNRADGNFKPKGWPGK